jgi:hypothetical protein
MNRIEESNLEENTPLLSENGTLERNKPDQLDGISPLAVGGKVFKTTFELEFSLPDGLPTVQCV